MKVKITALLLLILPCFSIAKAAPLPLANEINVALLSGSNVEQVILSQTQNGIYTITEVLATLAEVAPARYFQSIMAATQTYAPQFATITQSIIVNNNKFYTPDLPNPFINNIKNNNTITIFDPLQTAVSPQPPLQTAVIPQTPIITDPLPVNTLPATAAGPTVQTTLAFAPIAPTPFSPLTLIPVSP